MKISVIMPALNEEKNIAAAMTNTLRAFDDFKFDGELIVVNDGSSDGTAQKVKEHALRDSRIRMIEHPKPHGIGASFWDGVDNSKGDAVMVIPGDNENNPWEMFRYASLLQHVDLVIPFLFNKETRSLFRIVLSATYRSIINTTFRVNLNYTNGTVLYRRSILTQIKSRSYGFFYQTDILIRVIKAGYLFAEVPYRINIREAGVSKAVTFPSLFRVMKGYLRLLRDFYFTDRVDNQIEFTRDSSTERRTSELRAEKHAQL